jgi:hypothetical protein
MKPSVREALGTEMDAGFEKACQQYAAVRHASITVMHDMGEFSGYEYVIIEYVAGIPLTERIKGRPLTDCEALKLMAPIADGLAALCPMLCDFIMRCLQREAKDRFSSTQEFTDALHAVKSEH